MLEFKKSQAEMMDEINHINTKVDEIGGKVDKLKTQCEVYETQLTDQKHQLDGLVKTSEEIHSQFVKCQYDQTNGEGYKRCKKSDVIINYNKGLNDSCPTSLIVIKLSE